MAYDYALVHLKFTIPLALVLTLAACPILNRTHACQIGVLVFIAFVATLPWDAYLIRHKIWTYPPEAVIGLTLYGIPLEELFFFVVQTYITSLVYILVNKPILHSQYLDAQTNPSRRARRLKRAGQFVLLGLAVYGAHLVQVGGRGTYLGLILVWAPPFALIAWSVAGLFMLRLPAISTVLPVVLPTLFLWLVDEGALRRGTWSIESGTKLHRHLFGTLDVEEAIFFLATNTLIVFGLAAFELYLAVIYTFPHIFPNVPETPTPLLLIQSRLVDKKRHDVERVRGIGEAASRLQRKSRSFYAASAAFAGRLRIDLVLLYSFCRMADDLVDDAKSQEQVVKWSEKLIKFLDLSYPNKCAIGIKKTEVEADPHRAKVVDVFIKSEFPVSARSALRLLPVHLLPPEPLYELIEGFKMDANFRFAESSTEGGFPIVDENALNAYARCVAGTVGELCLALVAFHCEMRDPAQLDRLGAAAGLMGSALQYVNIARDISADAKMGRVYIPTTWLRDEGLTPEDVVQKSHGDAVERLRSRLLDRAFDMYTEARPVMGLLPMRGRAPMVVAVEEYMEIGRVLRERTGSWTRGEGKATVPKRRRVGVAVRALLST